MKRGLVIILVLIFFQPLYAQKTSHPVTKKKVKVFENEEFSFQYPKPWKSTHKYIFKEKPIIKIAPSSVLRDNAYMVHFSIFAKTHTFKDLEEFILDRKKRYLKARKNDPISKKQMIITKIDSTHYVEKLQIIGENAYYLTQHHLIHYYFTNNKLYSLTYSATPDYYDEYLNDINYILNSFKFKTPKSALTPHPTP